MKIDTKKNKLIIPLIAITFAVWGMIIYNLVDYYSSLGNSEDEVIVNDSNLYTGNKSRTAFENESIAYETLQRDPFTFARKERKEPAEMEFIPAQNIVPPKPEFRYQVNGAIINDKSKLIIFEDITNNQTLFLREGETYNGIKIKKIAIDKVIVIEDGKSKDVNVRR